MNYIAEIKAFYDRLELNPLPSPAIALWHALMSIANKTGWQQEFTVAISVLVLKSGLNAQAIKRARNRLEQDGFITWKSRGGNQSAIYHLNSLVVQNDTKNVPQCEPQSVPQTEPQAVPQCEPQSVPINKHKQNETDISLFEHARAELPVRFNEFWNAYPKKVNMLNAQGEYTYVLETTAELTENALIFAALNYAEACQIRHTRERYIKNPENWLRESVWIDYLSENYKRPAMKSGEASKSSGGRKNSFNNFKQRQYDYDELEKMLLTTQPKG